MVSHERIANNIRAEIARSGLSIKEFSVLVGITYDNYINTLNRFQKGKDIRISFLEKTAKELNIPIEIFFTK